EGIFPNIAAVDRKLPLLRIVKTEQETDDRGFTDPGRSHQSHALSGGNLKINLVQHPMAAFVSKAYIHESYGSLERGGLAGTGKVGDLGRLFENIEHTFAGSCGLS